MKKILFILLLTCSLSLADIKWYSFRELIDNQNKIQPFDIIVLSKGDKLFQQWGHCFLVNEDMKLTINFDYTKWFGSGYTISKREEYYCYKYLGKTPEDKKQEELFKEMEEYQSKFNK